MENKVKNAEITLPCGEFCGKNCADDCIYWNPSDRRSDGRTWCEHYNTYYYPSERNGCFSHRSY